MDIIHIHGGIPLQGQVKIQGSKNSALPILAATVLTSESSVLHNCPRIADVFHMQTLLINLGCRVKWEGDSVRVDTENVTAGNMLGEAVTGMRSSLTLMGALLGRCGHVVMEHPGGCVIGSRPIDLHIDALKKMNVLFEEDARELHAYTEGLEGAEIELSCASVGATENIVLAAVLAHGRTIIRGAAKEPEVVAMCGYLKACGARITGEGTGDIRIEGVSRLHGAEYTIPNDRIVAGTYLLGCMASGGEVLLEGAPVEQMEAVISVAEQMGAMCQPVSQGLYVQAPERASAISALKTLIYPGFPTDLQSPLLAVLAGAEGNSVVEETIFENRFRVVPYLERMGARIRIEDNRTAYVEGCPRLWGTAVAAEELRGGAALVVAGLGAAGETVIRDCAYINRGYVNICRDLRELGARIYSV